MCDFGCGSSDSNSNSSTSGQFNTNGTSSQTGSTTRSLPSQFVPTFQNYINTVNQSTNPYALGSGNTMNGLTNQAVTDLYAQTRGTNPNTQTAINTMNGLLGAKTNTLAQYDANGNVLNTGYTPVQAAMANAPANVAANSGAAMSQPYQSLYSQQLIDPSLQAFDYGTDRAMSALDARQAGSGAFAGNRGGLAYSDLGTQAALQRGQLESQLKSQGLNSAFGFGTQDASRTLSGDQGNQQTALTTALANQSSANNAGQFNANLANNRQQFDVNSMNNTLDQKSNQAINLANLANGVDASHTANLNSLAGIGQNNTQNMFAALQQAGIPIQAIMNFIGTNSSQTGQTSQTGDYSSNTTGNSSTSSTKFGF